MSIFEVTLGVLAAPTKNGGFIFHSQAFNLYAVDEQLKSLFKEESDFPTGEVDLNKIKNIDFYNFSNLYPELAIKMTKPNCFTSEFKAQIDELIHDGLIETVYEPWVFVKYDKRFHTENPVVLSKAALDAYLGTVVKPATIDGLMQYAIDFNYKTLLDLVNAGVEFSIDNNKLIVTSISLNSGIPGIDLSKLVEIETIFKNYLNSHRVVSKKEAMSRTKTKQDLFRICFQN